MAVNQQNQLTRRQMEKIKRRKKRREREKENKAKEKSQESKVQDKVIYAFLMQLDQAWDNRR